MWHEARKREKATQKLFNDHKKRAEKRRDENRIDPNSLLQIHGIKAKLCLDPSVYKQAVKSMVVWQGDKSTTIDRFDVRATLNSIPSDTSSQSGLQRNDKNKHAGRGQTVLDVDESESMKKILNYERYRLLIQSDLNKIPEELRLKLVTDSDVLSDAKMRKLRNNKFGTSGDASISTSQFHPTNNQRFSRSRDPVKRVGAAIGYTYSSEPPCSSDTSADIEAAKQGHNNPTSYDGSTQANYMDILDLVDNDNFNLESVNLANIDQKRCDETARKYSLTVDELLLLAERDSLEAAGASDILRELDRVKDKLDSCKSLTGGHDNQVYGPALPPDLIASASQNLDTLSPDSPSNSSPVRQRSPSGVADVPLRNGHHGSESSDSFEATDTKSLKSSEPRARALSPKPDLIKTISTSVDSLNDERNTAVPIDDESNKPFRRQLRLENVMNEEIATRYSERRSDQMSPRRASTPLAYKKNCRSNRSLSREKRSRHRRSSHKRHRRTRSPSSSSSSSSYGSSSSSTSSSNSSISSSYSSRSSDSFRRTSKRKRRSRSRGGSYR